MEDLGKICQKKKKNERKRHSPHTPFLKKKDKRKKEKMATTGKAHARKKRIPDLEDIEEYARQFPDCDFTPKYFKDYNDGRSWRIDGRKIRDWKAIFQVWVENGAKTKASMTRRNASTEARKQRLETIEADKMEEVARIQAERNARCEREAEQHVSWEEFQRMKAEGLI